MFVRRSGITFILLLVFAFAALLFGRNVPASFLPDEDQGFFYVNLQLPNAASLQRTDAICRKIEAILSQTEGVRYTTTVAGFSLLSGVQSSYGGFFFVTLNPWEERKKLAEQYQVLKGRLNLALIQLPEATVFAFSPPAIPGLGVAGGVTFVLEDRGDEALSTLPRTSIPFSRPLVKGLNSDESQPHCCPTSLRSTLKLIGTKRSSRAWL